MILRCRLLFVDAVGLKCSVWHAFLSDLTRKPTKKQPKNDDIDKRSKTRLWSVNTLYGMLRPVLGRL